MNEKTLSLAVPCRNEAKRLSIDMFLQTIERWPWLSFCFVDDGSDDATAEILAHISGLSPAVHAIYLPRNVGKAEAVRSGILHLCKNTRTDYVGFWDADLATPLSEIPGFMRCFSDAPALEAVIGSRWPHLGAGVHRNAKRRFTSAIVKSLINRIVGAEVWDTQCGAKIFSRSLAGEIFEKPFRTRWLFDVELLMRIGKQRLAEIAREHPLDIWHDVPGSKLDSYAFSDLLKLIV